jgi:hypothetical protein
LLIAEINLFHGSTGHVRGFLKEDINRRFHAVALTLTGTPAKVPQNFAH